MYEVAFWNPKGNGGIERTSFVPDVTAAARYKHEVTIHQGRIERIIEENLNQYSSNCIRRRTKFVDFQMDPEGRAEFPLVVELDEESANGVKTRRIVCTKYVIGADGAHSQVRNSMALKLVGETTDHIWGVVDFVAETDFPDVRKRCAIHSAAGSVIIIPRERIYSGQYLTRLYVQMKDEVPADEDDMDDQILRQKSQQRRAAITLDVIMCQARCVLAPYSIGIKKGTQVDWWAAYQIGQRMTPKFSLKDRKNKERVFIVGDACHTHSPKAGQGMNVSMMDSYNLAWKLVHTIHGLIPGSPESNLLSTYEDERLEVAKSLIEFDTQFSSMFSGQIGSDTSVEGLTHDQFLKVFSNGSGFTSGCGIEYPSGLLTQSRSSIDYPIVGDNFLQGVLQPGRRVLDSIVKRYADANPRYLQDDLFSTGRFRIVVFTSFDLTDPKGTSSQALNKICRDILPTFPPETVELVVLRPFVERKFEWTDIPSCVKRYAEMCFHGAWNDDLYNIYGVDPNAGCTVIVRPDGYVGAITSLRHAVCVDDYLRRCLIKVG